MRYTRLILLIALAAGLLAACGSSAPQGEIDMADMSRMPDVVKNAPVSVREAYQFAVANPEVLKEIPCYCGCGAMGHTSNYSCYVQDDANGVITFDEHALGCSICVDITQDTMRMMCEGKELADIRAYIDQTYSQYGPSNIP